MKRDTAKKGKVICIRCTDLQKHRIEANANSKGMTVSQYILEKTLPNEKANNLSSADWVEMVTLMSEVYHRRLKSGCPDPIREIKELLEYLEGRV